MNDSQDKTQLELPFGAPPITPDIRDELRSYIECPEKLPIHQLERTQLHIPREPDILKLLNFDLSPLGTTLKFDRDPITGKLSYMREVALRGVGENAKNSMFLTRAPGPVMEGIQGNPSNLLFWPGGFDELDPNKSVPTSNINFDKNLRTLAKGLKTGIEFAADNFTVKDVEKTDIQKPKQTKNKVNIVDLMSIVHDEENKLGLWSQTVKSEETVKTFDDTAINVDVKSIDNLVINDTTPVIKLTEKPKLMVTAWAEQLDVSVPVQDYHQKVPKPAITFDYKLDTFQKQAIIKLEEGCNIFVAAHTSAGKTTVAEYAIALSQRHMTRVIYTSPIKALSNQKYRDFKRNKHFESIGLVTGDIQINQTANCLIMTTEILQTMLYNASEVIRDLEYVIFDEVHYINNEDRGHVWEEIVILLPHHVNIVMLSATVPNPLTFANWVGSIKKKKMYVISTLKRPTPLQHYMYTGKDGKTRDDRLLILDGDGNFYPNNWHTMATIQTSRLKNSNQRVQLGLKQAKTRWEAFIAHLKEHKLLPVVIFTLSRNRCDQNAELLSSIDLTTQTEKSHVKAFFTKCIKKLNESDRQLPQIIHMRELLERGIGVHHSGILPLIKEIIELLFQNGIVKLLFATETFAMGINMPAKTVVFDSIRKFDGKQFRDLLSTEYIQMAGRAGRRGHDKSGTVIVMCPDKVPPMSTLKAMMCGDPRSLQSQFKITYSMVLNLRRVSESVTIEDIMRRSFKEISSTATIDKRKSELTKIEETLASFPPFTGFQKQLSDLYYLAVDWVQEWKIVKPQMLSTKQALNSLHPGRILSISYRHHYNKLAVFLVKSEVKKVNQYLVLVLSNHDQVNAKDDKPDIWHSFMALMIKKIFVPTGVPIGQFLLIGDENINQITTFRIYTDLDSIYNDYSKRRLPRFRNDPFFPATQKAINELASFTMMASNNPKQYPSYIVLPVKNPELLTRLKSIEQLTTKIEQMNLSEGLNLELLFDKIFKRIELECRRRDLQFQLSDESMALYPDYVNRVKVLKRLKYLDSDERITLKGRVALDLDTNQLLITELIYRNVLTHLEPAEIAAVLSGLVLQSKNDSADIEVPAIKETCEIITQVRDEIELLESEYNLEPVEPLNFGLVRVVYEWARAETFAKIMELTTVQEGVIVRCIQKLNDALKGIKSAANRIGETVLKEKMEEASTAIKRDIVFTASLYTQD